MKSIPPREQGEPFAIDVTTNNRKVLAYETALKPLSGLRYLVCALGCGHEYSITHKSLMEKRLKHGAGLCRTCSRKRYMGIRHKRNAENKQKNKILQVLQAWQHPSPEQAKILWAHSLWPPTSSRKVANNV